MPSVWYVGRANIRTLTVDDWQRLGVVTTEATTWDAENGWSIPHAEFTTPQLNALENLNEFTTGAADGPRSFPLPPPGSALVDHIASIYYNKIVEIYNEILGLEPGGGGGGLDTTAVNALINTAINNLINGAPGTRDTLKEISDILTADEGAVSALTTVVGNKVAKTGDETIAGIKTFSSPPVLPSGSYAALNTVGIGRAVFIPSGG